MKTSPEKAEAVDALRLFRSELLRKITTLKKRARESTGKNQNRYERMVSLLESGYESTKVFHLRMVVQGVFKRADIESLITQLHKDYPDEL